MVLLNLILSEYGPSEFHLLHLDLVLPHHLSAPGLPSPSHSDPGSSESGPFSSGPKFGSFVFDIDIEKVLN